jgi:hypothetical protein
VRRGLGCGDGYNAVRFPQSSHVTVQNSRTLSWEGCSHRLRSSVCTSGCAVSRLLRPGGSVRQCLPVAICPHTPVKLRAPIFGSRSLRAGAGVCGKRGDVTTTTLSRRHEPPNASGVTTACSWSAPSCSHTCCSRPIWICRGVEAHEHRDCRSPCLREQSVPRSNEHAMEPWVLR